METLTHLKIQLIPKMATTMLDEILAIPKQLT